MVPLAAEGGAHPAPCRACAAGQEGVRERRGDVERLEKLRGFREDQEKERV